MKITAKIRTSDWTTMKSWFWIEVTTQEPTPFQAKTLSVRTAPASSAPV
jgi:hypothetical protein